MPWYPVRRCVYAHSDYQLEVLADWMPWYPVRRRVYPHSDYQLAVLAD